MKESFRVEELDNGRYRFHLDIHKIKKLLEGMIDVEMLVLYEPIGVDDGDAFVVRSQRTSCPLEFSEKSIYDAVIKVIVGQYYNRMYSGKRFDRIAMFQAFFNIEKLESGERFIAIWMRYAFAEEKQSVILETEKEDV